MRTIWQKNPRDQLELALSLTRRTLRYWWVALIPGVVGAAGALGIGLIHGRTYESRTVIMYRELVPTRILQGPDALSGERNMANRIEDLAMSRPILAQVREKYDLFPDIARSDGVDDAIEELRSRVKLKSRGAGTFHLSFQGDTPDQAQTVTAGLAELLMNAERDFQREEVVATRGLLGKEQERIEKELHDRERELARFLAQHPEFAQETTAGLAGATGASIRARTAGARRDDLKDPKLLALERQRSRIRERIYGRAPQGETSSSTEIGDARRAVSEARQRLEEARGRYRDQHPDVLAAQSGLRRATERLERARRGTGDGERAEPVSSAQREALSRELSQVEDQIRRWEQEQGNRPATSSAASHVVDLETSWARLSREVEEARDEHDAIEAKSFAAEFAGASGLAGEGARMVVLDPATRPTRPAGLGMRMLALAGLVVFGGLGAVLAIALGFADDRIGRESDLARFGLGRAIAVIPRGRRIKS